MPETHERRSRPRIALSLPLAIYGEGERERLVMLAHTVDVSTAGVLVKGAGRVRVGQRVRIEVARGDERNPLGISALVVRIAHTEAGRTVRGAAMQFTDVTAIDEALLARMITER